MTDRIVLGKADGSSWGLWVSKEGVNVIDGSGNLTSDTNLLFDSRKQYFGQIQASKYVFLAASSTVTVSYNPYGQRSYGYFYFTDSAKETLTIGYNDPLFGTTSPQVLLSHTYTSSSSASFSLQNLNASFAFRVLLLIVRAPG